MELVLPLCCFSALCHEADERVWPDRVWLCRCARGPSLAAAKRSVRSIAVWTLRVHACSRLVPAVGAQSLTVRVLLLQCWTSACGRRSRARSGQSCDRSTRDFTSAISSSNIRASIPQRRFAFWRVGVQRLVKLLSSRKKASRCGCGLLVLKASHLLPSTGDLGFGELIRLLALPTHAI